MTNYEEIKEAYINGIGNLRELAAKYRVSYETLRRRAAKDNWKALRDVSRSEGSILDRQLRITESMLDMADKELCSLREDKKTLDIKQFFGVVRAVKEIFTIQHGIIQRQAEATNKPDKDADQTDAPPIGFTE